MSMSKKMDAGDIISQRSIKIEDDMILDDLYSKMSYLGKELLLDTLPSIIDGSCTYIKQDDELVTFGYNVSKEDEKIDFSVSIEKVRNKVRGLNSIPGAYCYLDDLRMKIYEVEIKENTKYQSNKIGEIVEVTNNSIVVLSKDSLIYIKDIAIEGKKRCKVKDYFNGIKKETILSKEKVEAHHRSLLLLFLYSLFSRLRRLLNHPVIPDHIASVLKFAGEERCLDKTAFGKRIAHPLLPGVHIGITQLGGIPAKQFRGVIRQQAQLLTRILRVKLLMKHCCRDAQNRIPGYMVGLTDFQQCNKLPILLAEEVVGLPLIKPRIHAVRTIVALAHYGRATLSLLRIGR